MTLMSKINAAEAGIFLKRVTISLENFLAIISCRSQLLNREYTPGKMAAPLSPSSHLRECSVRQMQIDKLESVRGEQKGIQEIMRAQSPETFQKVSPSRRELPRIESQSGAGPRARRIGPRPI